MPEIGALGAARSNPGVFITGTDTGIGKTFVACALLRGLRDSGIRAVGMKPIAAGSLVSAQGLANEDALALNRASAFESDMALVNPYCFPDPIAPHLAARDARVAIDLERIRKCYLELHQTADFVVVEGAGGFLVPLGPTLSFADLSLELGLPIVLVVGMRLGCLNHALLTAEAIERRRLPFAGWIANRIDPSMRSWESNLETLRQCMPASFLGLVPYSEDGDDAGPDTLDSSLILEVAEGAFLRSRRVSLS